MCTHFHSFCFKKKLISTCVHVQACAYGALRTTCGSQFLLSVWVSGNKPAWQAWQQARPSLRRVGQQCNSPGKKCLVLSLVSDFDLWNRHGGWRKPTVQGCPLTTTCAPWHMCPPQSISPSICLSVCPSICPSLKQDWQRKQSYQLTLLGSWSHCCCTQEAGRWVVAFSALSPL